MESRKTETQQTPQPQTQEEVKNLVLTAGPNYFKKALSYLKDLFTPNKRVSGSSTTMIIVGIWLVGVILMWTTSEHRLIPTPLEIISATSRLLSIDKIESSMGIGTSIATVINSPLFSGFLSSTFLAVKALTYAIVIAYALATLSTLTFFKPLAGFFANSRFLSTVGFGFVFAQLTANTSEQKVALLVFGITVFLLTSFLGVILDIKKSEYDYAKTLKLGHWQAYWEIVVLGKSDLMIDAIRQNFAIAWMMLPMVENLCRADGGIGILLTDQSKYFHLDAVYAIQIVLLFTGIALDQFIGWLKGVIRPDSLINLQK